MRKVIPLKDLQELMEEWKTHSEDLAALARLGMGSQILKTRDRANNNLGRSEGLEQVLAALDRMIRAKQTEV